MKKEEEKVIRMEEQMKQIISKLNDLQVNIDKKFDKVDCQFTEVREQINNLDKKFATKEELKSFKSTTRMYKNGVLVIFGGVTAYLITYIFNQIFHVL